MKNNLGFSQMGVLVGVVVLGISFQFTSRALISSWRNQKSISQTYSIDQHRRTLGLFLRDPQVCKLAFSNKEFDPDSEHTEDKSITGIQVSYPGAPGKIFSGTNLPLEEGAKVDQLVASNFIELGSNEYKTDLTVIGRRTAGVGGATIARSLPLVVRTESLAGNRKRIIDCFAVDSCEESKPVATPSAPIVVSVPLECGHVVYNSDAFNNQIDPRWEKKCSLTFELADYYPAAENKTYSKIEIDFKSAGWSSMAPDLGEGYFTNLQGHHCQIDSQKRYDLGWTSKPTIELSETSPGYYFASPNPTSPIEPGAGPLETNVVDWFRPLYNGAKHVRFLATYAQTSRHKFRIENKLNGWGSCSKDFGCAACISDVSVRLYP